MGLERAYARSGGLGWQGKNTMLLTRGIGSYTFLAVILTTVELEEDQPVAQTCGACERCRAGDEQICDRYYQPGFTGWGSFAEYVALPYADRAEERDVYDPQEETFVWALAHAHGMAFSLARVFLTGLRADDEAGTDRTTRRMVPRPAQS